MACNEATTSAGIGTGVSNSASILSVCEGNTAAKFCDDFVNNGKDDWFLPSLDETMLFASSIPNMSYLVQCRLITSTGFQGVFISYHYDTEVVDLNGTVWSSFGMFFCPVRRF